MTVLQGAGKPSGGANLEPLAGLVRACQERAVTYLRAMGSSAPEVHRLGAELAGAVLDLAGALETARKETGT